MLVNPEIVAVSHEQATREEGCLSLPGQYADVTRPARVKVRYHDLEGAQQEIEAEGLLAACLQHELDHLDGVLFVDHLSALKRNMLLRRLAKELKQKPQAKAAGRMRLAFLGSPAFAVPALRGAERGPRGGVRSTASRPAPPGAARRWRRARCMRPPPALGLPVRHPVSFKRDPAAQAAFAALDLDAAVVAAYGLILPQAMLDAPRRGCLNIHASLLPRWRGAGPIQAAVLAGDAESGVTIMQMEAGLDTGPMLVRGAVADRPARHRRRACTTGSPRWAPP